MIFQAAHVTSDMDETLKSILTRLSGVEIENRALKQQNNHLMQEIVAVKHDNHRLNDLGERLTKQIGALEQENSRLNEELLNMKDTFLLHTPNVQ